MHFQAEKAAFTWASLRPCWPSRDSPAAPVGIPSLHTQYIQAEGIFQLSKLPLFHPICELCPADMAFFSDWASTPPPAKPPRAEQEVKQTSNMGPSPVWQWFCTILKLPRPGNLRAVSLFFTPSAHSWSPMARRAPANHPLLQAAGRKLSGTQLWNIQRGADLSSLSSSHHEHLHQLLLVPLSLSHIKLWYFGPGKLRE